MAEKKKDKPKNKAPKAEETQDQKDARAINKLFGGKKVKGANAVVRQFFPEGSLGRVDSGFDAQGNRQQENQDLLNRARGNMEAYGPGGGARRSSDVDAAIKAFRQGMGRTGETYENLARLKSGMLRTAEDTDTIANFKARSGRTTEDADVLGRMQAGLEGYSSAENQAQLESQLRDTNKAYQEGQNNVSRDAAKLGVRGGVVAALGAQNERARARAEAEARQNIFVANADEKDRRLQNYGKNVGRIQSDEQGRNRDYAETVAGIQRDERMRGQDYASSLRNAELDEQGRQRDFYDTVNSQEDREYRQEQDSYLNYRDTLGQMRGDERSRQEYNNAQIAAERSGQANTFFGTIGYKDTRDDAKEAAALNRDYYNLAKSQYGGGGGSAYSGGDGRTNPNGASSGPDYEGYYRAREDATNRYYS